jgi:hypothetical protein
MSVTQRIADFGGQLLDQARRQFVISDVGHRQFGGQRDPDTPDRNRQMELPPVPPAVIAALRPPGFGVNRRMWNLPFSRCFLCHSPPPVRNGVLSSAAARPCPAHGRSSITR